MSGYLLETQRLTKHFGGLKAVDDLSFAVKPGEVRGVIGPNGAGKSTLFGLISGHLTPTSGEIFFDSHEISGLAPNRVARIGIARKFQITQVFTSMTVRENMELAVLQQTSPSTLGLLTQRRLERRTDIALDQVQLTENAETPASQLSHGEQQRLELGMVLATGAKLLLLDEPTAGMSLEERSAMSDLVRRLAAEATIIITEHDFDFIKVVSQTVTVLNNGTKLAEGSVSHVEADPQVRACYLGEAHA